MRRLFVLTFVLTCSVGLADELPSNTREIETLTVEQAETLVGREQWSLYLDGLTTLSPDVAKILAQVKGQISLNGLTTLSKETAEQLTAPPQGLRSRQLSLNGLSTLSPAVAEELVKIKGQLQLRGLKVVSPELAAILITHHSFEGGDFGLESISPDLARVLARSESHLDLSSLKRLDPETASAFSQHTASIGLSGLQLIDRDTAQALAKYRGMAIVLSGLRSIKTDVASELSHWPGEKLYLDGLAQIDPETAACLAECKTKQLGLSGLNSISPEVAAELAKFSGSSLNLSGLTQPILNVIQCLGNFHGSLNLGGLSSIDEEKAKAISSLPSDRLQLSAINASNNVRSSGWGGSGDNYDFHTNFGDSRDGYSNPASINPGIAAALSLFQGKELVLRGLTTIDKESAQALSSFKGKRLSLECLDRLDDEAFDLLEEIQTVVLNLKDFRRLTGRQAKKLVETENKKSFSYLHNLEFIDKAVAKELLEFKGSLNLNHLKSIDDEALEILKQRPNLNLNLANLTSLTAKQLRQLLSENKGRYLSLELESLTPEIARILSSYDGEINRYQLQTLSDECFDILLESDLKRPQHQRSTSNLPSLTPHQASVLSEHLDEDEFDHILLNLDAIDVPLARWLVENREYINCPGASVDQEVVKILVEHKGGLGFDELDWSNISPEFVSALSGFQGNLSFSWDVTQLSNEAELIFAGMPGTLNASYLHEIKTPELANKLVASHNKNKQAFFSVLYFEELNTLSVPVAQELVKAKGGLSLPSIKFLPPNVATILATYQDGLELPGLTRLESQPLAVKLLETAGNAWDSGIELNLMELSPEIAEVLSKYEVGLSLNGLRDISPATAQNLMNCEGRLVIGLPELTPEIAKILVHHRGDLVLNIENLTPETAKVLINRQGDLKLGLKHLTSDVAEILVNREDPLWIGEVTIDEELANILSQARGDLYVELRTIKPQIIAPLVRKEGTLVLWGLSGDQSFSSHSSQLSKEVAKQLASTKGTILLSLNRNQPLLNIQKGYSNHNWRLDRETAEILAETEGTLILDRLHVNHFDVAKSLSTLKGTLSLPSISIPDSPFEGSTLSTKPNVHVGTPHFGKSLSAEEAAVLVLIQSVNPSTENWGCPRSVETITEEAAIELADYRGDFLNLHGVTTLSPEAAEALATYHGSLVLDALENLTPAVAKQLIKCKGGLSLRKLAKPTPEVCEILASCSGPLRLSGLEELESVDLASKLVADTSESDWTLDFDGLTSISIPIVTALARSHATLSFAGLTAISEKQAKALARCSGGLCLGGLTQLTAETAKELAQCKGYLDLNGLTAIDPKVAEILSNARGELVLGGLHSITSVALAQKLVADANKEAPDDEWTERSLDLYSLKTITSAVGKVLSATKVPLYLNGLEQIDAEIAKSLSQSTDVSLAGLESITADVATELAQFKGSLDLSGLKEPKKEIVQALEKKKFGTLYLSQDVLDEFPALTENEFVEVGYGGGGGGMGGGMF